MKDDGGPAFPCELTYTKDGQQGMQTGPSSGIHTGLSVRDYFAAKAMHAELNTAGAFEGPAKALAEEAEREGRSIEAQIAFNAYTLADAMLAERESQSPGDPRRDDR